MIGEGLAQLRGHQAGVTGALKKMVEACHEFIATGVLSGQPGSDARAEGDEFFAAQLLDQAGVAREHDTKQGLGVETGRSARRRSTTLLPEPGSP